MNLRYLVPALGIIAVSVPVTNAEDKAAPAPVITFDGWNSAILSVSSANEPAHDVGGAGDEREEKSLLYGFSDIASIKANIKISDNVSGKINIWLNPGAGNPGTAENGQAASLVDVREAYSVVAINDEWSIQAGKYINTIGWISPEPTGLYTVNNSLIGYLGMYGDDVIGVSALWEKKNCPIHGSVHITNGYFNAANESSVGPESAFGAGSPKFVTQNGTDLGYGLDLSYDLPGDNNFINLDVAYDMHGGYIGNYFLVAPVGAPAAVPFDLGSNVFLVGLNGQYNITQVKGLLVAAEVMGAGFGDLSYEDHSLADTGGRRYQGLFLANYTLPKGTMKFPVSVTGEIQRIQVKGQYAGAITEKATEETLAILTNPTNSNYFALNGELSFTQFNDGAPTVDRSVALSIQALLSF